MGTGKAPGADGLSMFFRKYWEIVAEDVRETVRGIVDHETISSGLNHTVVALIPKVKQPTSPMEFIPISLCNILYKMTSEVLTNRLKVILDKIIFPTQSAFVAG
ncbi:unnamed protein product [Linum trigynum]|uniref:Reverse transcriptase domain-containing protein n=1 Tax=Linum trigynum TaxID=586398 RepID=A0AAV2DEJ8_9ROSI